MFFLRSPAERRAKKSESEKGLRSAKMPESAISICRTIFPVDDFGEDSQVFRTIFPVDDFDEDLEFIGECFSA